MKKIYFHHLILMIIFFSSCEDVIKVDLSNSKPILVVEASINWQKGTMGNDQKIKLTTTTDYFSNIIPTVSGATVFIKNTANTVFTFTEIPNSGEYVCNDFVPLLNETYILTVIHNGQTYIASETLNPVAPIDLIEQNNEGGFSGTDIEVKAFYIDPANENNYYLYKYKYSNQAKPDYYVDRDQFFQGNQIFSVSQKGDLKIGDQIEISHFGISKQYFNYMAILMSTAENAARGPFQSPPAKVKGNLINTTNFDNYALGYVRLSEVDRRNYTVE